VQSETYGLRSDFDHGLIALEQLDPEDIGLPRRQPLCVIQTAASPVRRPVHAVVDLKPSLSPTATFGPSNYYPVDPDSAPCPTSILPG